MIGLTFLICLYWEVNIGKSLVKVGPMELALRSFDGSPRKEDKIGES